MQETKRILERLIKYEGPLEENIAALEALGAEGGEPLVTLTRSQTISILKLFIGGKITGEELYKWADALEMREDLDFGDEGDEGAVFRVVSNISTTYALRGPLTREEAVEYVAELQNTGQT